MSYHCCHCPNARTYVDRVASIWNTVHFQNRGRREHEEASTDTTGQIDQSSFKQQKSRILPLTEEGKALLIVDILKTSIDSPYPLPHIYLLKNVMI